MNLTEGFLLAILITVLLLVIGLLTAAMLLVAIINNLESRISQVGNSVVSGVQNAILGVDSIIDINPLHNIVDSIRRDRNSD
jgi:cell shape-determining protein MreC